MAYHSVYLYGCACLHEQFNCLSVVEMIFNAYQLTNAKRMLRMLRLPFFLFVFHSMIDTTTIGFLYSFHSLPIR